jgi:hypothetical protein
MCVRESPFAHRSAGCRRDGARRHYQLRAGRRLPIKAYTMESGLGTTKSMASQQQSCMNMR